MKQLKKIIDIFYTFICNTINILKSKKYKKVYRENISLNDSTHFSDIKNKRLNSNNDISHHFDNLFYEVTSHRPKLILELGVRKGESTYVFNKIQKV